MRKKTTLLALFFTLISLFVYSQGEPKYEISINFAGGPNNTVEVLLTGDADNPNAELGISSVVTLTAPAGTQVTNIEGIAGSAWRDDNYFSQTILDIIETAFGSHYNSPNNPDLHRLIKTINVVPIPTIKDTEIPLVKFDIPTPVEGMICVNFTDGFLGAWMKSLNLPYADNNLKIDYDGFNSGLPVINALDSPEVNLLKRCLILPSFLPPQLTYIPDNNFEIAMAGCCDDYSNDNHAFTHQILLLDTLNISNLDIYNMTGIQDFTPLSKLNISNNNIDSIFLENNINLTEFDFSNNHFTNINLSNNTLLTKIIGNNNNLEEIDLSNNLAITYFEISNNQINELDLSKQTNLTHLNASNNEMTILDLRNGANNNMTNVDLRGNPDLCIYIDDYTAASNNSGIYATWLLDSTANFINENGIGDLCNPDDDGDGIIDEDDNCPFVSNPEQEDADYDGIGDVCDPVENLVGICHKPGTPAEKTKYVPVSALPGHFGHGDILGPCNGNNDDDVNNDNNDNDDDDDDDDDNDHNNENLSGKSFSFYPNPSEGHITIEVDEYHIETYFTIADLFGNHVATIPIEPFVEYIEIDLSFLDAGIYILYYPRSKKSKKIVIK